MQISRIIRSKARKLMDSVHCRNLPSKRNIGSPEADNWFVLTDSLSPQSVIYSGGVGKDIFFELALAKEFGCKIFLFDPSPTGAETIRSLKMPENMKFYPIGLAGTDSKLNFAAPINPLEGSYRLGNNENNIQYDCRSITSLAKENGHHNIELLKIDIEGFEYDVLNDILNSNLSIRQIAVEFHDFYENIGSEKTLNTIARLKKHGYKLYHKRGHDYSFVKAS